MAQSTTSKTRLLQVYTKGYESAVAPSGLHRFVSRNKPIFYRSLYIPEMMKDPRINFGVKIIRGPILSKGKFLVETESEELHEFLVRQVTRFWTKGAPITLSSLVHGYSGSEVIYKFNHKQRVMDFFALKHLYQKDVRPVVKDGEFVGMEISRLRDVGKIFLKTPKVLWSVHDKIYNRWYGKSLLEGAFIPWWEMWMQEGYRDIRQLWFFKNAYRSGALRYPAGSSPDKDGVEVPNVILATELLDRISTGSGVALPSSPGGQENEWDYIDASGNSVPDGLLEYGSILGDEVWEGLGVPPEVVSADGTGAFAGRRVPQQAFFSTLQEILNEQLCDFDEQVLRPLVGLNFGPKADYDISAQSLLDILQQEEMGLITGKIEDRAGNQHNKREEVISDNQEETEATEEIEEDPPK